MVMQESIYSLLGKIGTQDVQDVQTAVDTALEDHKFIDGSKIAVFGGSHGGFLTAHLTGQHPGCRIWF